MYAAKRSRTSLRLEEKASNKVIQDDDLASNEKLIMEIERIKFEEMRTETTKQHAAELLVLNSNLAETTERLTILEKQYTHDRANFAAEKIKYDQETADHRAKFQSKLESLQFNMVILTDALSEAMSEKKLLSAASSSAAAIATVAIATDVIVAAIMTLTNALAANQASHLIDKFVDLVLRCRANPTGDSANVIILRWKGYRNKRDITAKYYSVKDGTCGHNLSADALCLSRDRFVSRKSAEMNSIVDSVSQGHFGPVMKAMAKRSGLFVIEHEKLLLSVADCIAVRDHLGIGTNGLYRLKQALEALVPFLKGLLIPPSIINKVSREERVGVIPCRVFEMNCLLNKKLNKRDMCTFFFCENTGQLLADLQRSTFVSGEYENSCSFSCLKNKLVSSIGMDKGGNNLLATMRDCNRRKGNAGIHVQCPGCLEGPVAECYENVNLTFCNPIFSLRQTFNDLVGDFYFSLVFFADRINGNRAASVSIFKPVPLPPQLTNRKFNVTFSHLSIPANVVTFDDDRNDSGVDLRGNAVSDDTGLPPEIIIPREQEDIGVRLVHSNESASRFIGYQMLIGDTVIVTNRMYHVFELGTFPLSELNVLCLQNIGNLANDNKMINILTGQGSCRVKCPMSCCTVPLENLGDPPKWIQRKLLDEKVAAGTDVLVDHTITNNFPQRVGDLSFSITSAKFQYRMAEGQMGTEEDRMRINIATGSSFRPNLTDFHCHKTNCGFFHAIQAHTTKLTDCIVNACDERMKMCRWQHRQDKFKDEEAALRIYFEKELKKAEGNEGLAYSTQRKNIRAKITRTKNKIIVMDKRGGVYMRDRANAEILREQVEILEDQLENLLCERRVQANDSEISTLYLILGGLKDLEIAFDNGQHGNLPKNGVSWAFIKSIESRAGGKIDHKRTGTEMANGKGMTCLQNWNHITTALMGLYPEDSVIHEWLGEMTPKWE